MKYIAYYIDELKQVDVVTDQEFNDMPAAMQEIAQILYKGNDKSRAKMAATECEVENELEHNEMPDMLDEHEEFLQNFYAEDLQEQE